MKHISDSKRVEILSRVCSGALLVAFSSPALAWDHDHDGKPVGPLVWVDKKGKTIGRAVGDARVQVKVERLELVLPLGFIQVCSAPNTACRFTLGLLPGVQVWPQSVSPSRIAGVLPMYPSLRRGRLSSGCRWSNALYRRRLGSDPSGSPLLPPPLSYQRPLSGDGSCFNATGPLWPAWKVEKTLGLGTLRFTPPFTLR